MRDDICWVCNSEGANILCPKCGHIICQDCYDEETKRCLECVEDYVNAKAWRKKVMLMGGLIMIIVGLSTVAAGIVMGIPVKEVTVVFPFMVGEVSPMLAGLYSFLFFMTIASASMLPWYVHIREKPTYEGNEDFTVMEGNLSDGENFEHIEYVITAELPKRMEKTILVESNGTSIHLHSTLDKEFKRNYTIPDGHDLEGLDYDYEEGYLVLRLHLVRIP
jgi:uncharacterized protein (DUF983 family)